MVHIFLTHNLASAELSLREPENLYNL